MKITGRVWIGEDVFLENTYPECIELRDEYGGNLHSVLLAHWRGSSKIIVERNARIGACFLVTAAPGEIIVVGEGSMVAAGSVITKSVASYTLVADVPAKPIATLKYAPSNGVSYKQFKSGITRLTPPKTQEAGVSDGGQ